MNEQDRKDLLEFRQQTVVMLEATRRIVEMAEYAQQHTEGFQEDEFVESARDMMRYAEEMIVGVDFILSGLEEAGE